MATPAIVAWTPEASIAIHTPRPTRKYGTPWRTPAPRSTSTTPNRSDGDQQAPVPRGPRCRQGRSRSARDVVDDHERQQEDADPRRAPATDQGEDPQRERRVGAHRDAPAPRRRLTGVEREEDEGGGDHAADARRGPASRPADVPAARPYRTPAGSRAPTTKKKKAISPSLTQWRKSRASSLPADPDRELGGPQALVADDHGEFAHTSAATVAASRTRALAFSFARNSRTGRARRGSGGVRAVIDGWATATSSTLSVPSPRATQRPAGHWLSDGRCESTKMAASVVRSGCWNVRSGEGWRGVSPCDP